MNVYKVMVVDDELNQARVVADMVKRTRVEGEFEVDLCTDLVSLRDALLKGRVPNIVFMDIELGGAEGVKNEVDGIEAARQLLAEHPEIQLIYVTGFPEYCTRIYRTDHIYCLLKPVLEADFEDALAKAVNRIKSRATRPFGVKVGGRIMRIVPADIECIESDRRKVRIYSNGDVIEAYESLSGIASYLPDCFIQCHKSFLVNMEKIVEMRSDGIDLVSGRTIPVSQKRSRAARAAFLDYLRERI